MPPSSPTQHVTFVWLRKRGLGVWESSSAERLLPPPACAAARPAPLCAGVAAAAVVAHAADRRLVEAEAEGPVERLAGPRRSAEGKRRLAILLHILSLLFRKCVTPDVNGSETLRSRCYSRGSSCGGPPMSWTGVDISLKRAMVVPVFAK